MIKKLLLILGIAAVVSTASGTVPVKADTVCAPVTCAQPCTNEALLAQALLAQANWNDYVNRTIANQAAIGSTYADQILASNRYELIYQAALAHHFAAASPNPVTMQATLDWATLNMASADKNPYALAITYNPYNYCRK